MTQYAKALIAEIERGLEGVTPGSWFQPDAPWFGDGTEVLAGSPDSNVACLIADTLPPFGDRRDYEGPFEIGDAEADAAHIARMNPVNVRVLLDYITTLERRLEEAGKVIEPFSDIADLVDSETEGFSESDELEFWLYDYLLGTCTIAELRAAQSFLSTAKEHSEGGGA